MTDQASVDGILRAPSIDKANGSGVSGIYLRYYVAPNGIRGVYVGKAKDLHARQLEHDIEIKARRRMHQPHYAKACNATFSHAVTIASFGDSASDSAYVLRLAEQIFVLLFDSYSPGVVTGGEPSSNKALAVFLYRIADRVFDKTGWKKRWGVYGLNWSSPIQDLETSIAWTKNIRPNGYVIFQRPQKFRLSNEGKIHVRGLAKIRVGFDMGLQEGDKLNLLFGVAPPGKRHPIPFARSTWVGPFQDWSEVLRLGMNLTSKHMVPKLMKTGVRVEYPDPNGQYLASYVQVHTTEKVPPRPGDGHLEEFAITQY